MTESDSRRSSSDFRGKTVITANADVAPVVKNTVADWRNLFTSKEDQSLQFFPPSLSDGRLVVKPPKEVLEEGTCQWQNALVAQFLGRAPDFGQFQKMANLLWGREGKVEIKPVGPRLYIIQFPTQRTRDWVAESGPWHIQSQAIIVRKWEPSLKSLYFNMERIPVWIKLSNVPLELYTKTGLGYNASALGQPLYMDKATTLQQRLEYAKLCVEIAVDTELPSLIEVELDKGVYTMVTVEASWFPPKCLHCKVFGHVEKSCASKQEKIA